MEEMTLKSIKQAAETYFAAQNGSVREQVSASRQLARECSRTIESMIGRGIEARVVFYPPENPKAKKQKEKADHSASSSTTSS